MKRKNDTIIKRENQCCRNCAHWYDYSTWCNNYESEYYGPDVSPRGWCEEWIRGGRDWR